MESNREVNTKMERIRGISNQLGRKRPSAEQLEEPSPRMWALLQALPAFLGKHEQEFPLGLLPSPADACGGNGVLPAAGAETLIGFSRIGFKTLTEGHLFLN